MDEFTLNVTVEVNQVGNGLSIQRPVNLHIDFKTGRWQARGSSPSFESDSVESLDRAIISGACQARSELQAEVFERPPAINITPEDVARML